MTKRNNKLNTLESIKKILKEKVNGYPEFGSFKMFRTESLGWISKDKFIKKLEENNNNINENFTIVGVDGDKDMYFIFSDKNGNNLLYKNYKDVSLNIKIKESE